VRVPLYGRLQVLGTTRVVTGVQSAYPYFALRTLAQFLSFMRKRVFMHECVTALCNADIPHVEKNYEQGKQVN
jgi:hypothetical protein